MYEEVAHLLSQKYPSLLIEGDNYPPPAYKVYAAQSISLFKFTLLFLIIAGFNPFAYFNLETPQFFTWASENKVYACLMLFFVTNAIEGQMYSTGAFEVQLNDVPVWSKLQSGRVPAPQELFQIIDGQMQLSSSRASGGR